MDQIINEKQKDLEGTFFPGYKEITFAMSALHICASVHSLFNFVR